MVKFVISLTLGSTVHGMKRQAYMDGSLSLYGTNHELVCFTMLMRSPGLCYIKDLCVQNGTLCISSGIRRYIGYYKTVVGRKQPQTMLQ